MSHQLWSTLIKYAVSPNQIYFLDCCKHKIKLTDIIEQDVEKSICQVRGFIDSNNKLTPIGLQILEEFETYLVKTKKQVVSDILGVDFLEKVTRYRDIFPKGMLPSGELARQGINELKDKFVWFFKTYPEYTWELVIDAADVYVQLKAKVDFKYAVTSSYFIKKTDIRTKENKCALADYCQLLIDDPELKSLTLG